MSRAFVKESDGQWLNEIGPSVGALSMFLTGENNGIRVYELRSFINEKNQEIHEMSNGLSYTKDLEGKWMVIF